MPEFDATIRYRPIEGFPGYCVGTDGSVWSRKADHSWRRLKPSRGNRRGYLKVSLGAANPNRYVHTLVLEAFIGPCPEGMECLHHDDISTNNELNNLRWGNRTQNMADAVRNGKVPRGETHWNTRFGEEVVKAIRADRQRGMTLQAVADKHGTTESTVRRIARRESWAHVG